MLLDVTPLSLGIAIKGGLMSVVVPKNTNIPIKMSRDNFYTVNDN